MIDNFTDTEVDNIYSCKKTPIDLLIQILIIIICITFTIVGVSVLLFNRIYSNHLQGIFFNPLFTIILASIMSIIIMLIFLASIIIKKKSCTSKKITYL